ncbi:transcription factor 21 [Lingula anatina]|uniref:Transcription factor 21 n=1 Tax=Lingula anatina TaxID=7574 RepID=A0A1S3IFN4_LINAN|nr:transcription factor 21 [Lingula anatina]|eukprot:XP_013396671.1 transcription factor 21 [Lingula anatina]
MGRRRKESSRKEEENYSEFREKDVKPIQRNAANARERARMRVLSRAFSKLKTTLPWVPPDTKLSKLDTLRLAASYIAHLSKILEEDDIPESPVKDGAIHPINLTWPFSFNSRLASSMDARSVHAVRFSTRGCQAGDLEGTCAEYVGKKTCRV